MTKAWALMWYGVDESACYGIVTCEALAKEWESRDKLGGNVAEEFTVNKMPEIAKPNTACYGSTANPAILEYVDYVSMSGMLPDRK